MASGLCSVLSPSSTIDPVCSGNIDDTVGYGAPFVPKYSTCATFINDERHL